MYGEWECAMDGMHYRTCEIMSRVDIRLMMPDTKRWRITLLINRVGHGSISSADIEFLAGGKYQNHRVRVSRTVTNNTCL